MNDPDTFAFTIDQLDTSITIRTGVNQSSLRRKHFRSNALVVVKGHRASS